MVADDFLRHWRQVLTLRFDLRRIVLITATGIVLFLTFLAHRVQRQHRLVLLSSRLEQCLEKCLDVPDRIHGGELRRQLNAVFYLIDLFCREV